MCALIEVAATIFHYRWHFDGPEEENDRMELLSRN